MLPAVNQELLEKPLSKEDNLRMLLDMNGNVCEVVTGVVIGEIRLSNVVWIFAHPSFAAYPILTAPGYMIR
jgi:septum formation protein